MSRKTVTFYVEEHPITGELIDDEISADFPAENVVCYDCRGEGTTYLGWAAKDQPAFTAEDFDYEGPDFVDDYFSGRYDGTCPACNGNKVVLEIVEKLISDKDKPLWEAYQEHLEMEHAHWAECEAERRMGA